jgi:hypothetical protein
MKRKMLILVMGLAGLLAAYPSSGQRLSFGAATFFNCIADGGNCNPPNTAPCCVGTQTCCCSGAGNCSCKVCQ